MTPGSISPTSVRIASSDETSLVTDILTEAASWQAARGWPSWRVPFPRGIVEESIARRETYVLRLNETAVGTLALSWDDPTFWGSQPPDAGYLHRLAIRRRASALDLGAVMVQWAQRKVAQASRGWLRLDCAATNEPLRAYYEALGFVLVLEADVELPPNLGVANPWPAALYQLECSPVA